MTSMDSELPPPRESGPMTRTDFVRYQGASGDMNPIHHDDEVAAAAGFPSAFAPGMLIAGHMASWVADWCGISRIRRFGVRFDDQLWPGERIVCSGGVEQERTEVDGDYVDLWLCCETGDGREIARGWATFCLEPASTVKRTTH